MKKQMLRDVTFCDNCDSEESYATECRRCRKHFCFDCAFTGKMMKRYQTEVYVDKGSDSRYCLPCEAALKQDPTPLFRALLHIKELNEENKAWYARFEERRKQAEAEVESLIASAKKED